MVGLLTQSCQKDPENALEKAFSADIKMKQETQPPKDTVTKTRQTFNCLGKVLRKAFIILMHLLAVLELAGLTCYLLKPETNIAKSLQNISEQIKNHSVGKDFASYVVSSIPWTTEYLLATQMVFLIYIWTISYTKPKLSFDPVNIFVGDLIDTLTACCVTLLILGILCLASLKLITDYAFLAYIVLMVQSLCVGVSLVKVVVFDLKKAQLGIHDPRSFLEKVCDFWLFRTCEADSKLNKTDRTRVKGEMGFELFQICVLLLSGSHVFVQQNLRISEINEEIAKRVGNLLKLDVDLYVRTFLWISDYLIVTDIAFLVYLYVIKSLLTKTKRFATRVHAVSGTLIYWMTWCFIFLVLILLPIWVLANPEVPRVNFTDLIYLIFLEFCLLFCGGYILDLVYELKIFEEKQYLLTERT